MKIKATDIRKGMILRYEGQIVRVTDQMHITPGKGVSGMQVSMKNVETGSNVNNRFRSSDTIEKLSVDNIKMEYLYDEGEHHIFMNSETYDQVHLSKDIVGESIKYILPNTVVEVSYIEGKAVALNIPQKVTLKVVETEPGIKNATATNVLKPAKMETGLTVNVPPFISNEESIIVNTETGEYVSRA